MQKTGFCVTTNCQHRLSTQRETQVLPIRRPGSLTLYQSPKSLSYTPSENAVLLCSDVEGGSYELYTISKDDSFIGRGDMQEPKKGPDGSTVFVAMNRFVVLDKTSNQVLVKNLKNELDKKSALPIATDAIFYAGTGNLLCRSEDRVFIFDPQQRLVIGDLQTHLLSSMFSGLMTWKVLPCSANMSLSLQARSLFTNALSMRQSA
ncbi:hypothetical protein HN51_043821 [Arachis hypogaea]|nr:Coatomer subunit [Arachis hypogaea]